MKNLIISFLRRVSKSIIIVVAFCAVEDVKAQTVDTMEMKGEQFFVYPFKISVNAHRDYYRIIELESTLSYSYKQYKHELDKEFGHEMSKKEFKKLMKSFGSFQSKDERKYINAKFKRAVRANPYPLLEQNYNLNQDIIPVLDPIPDGKYIQLFEDFCLTDKKGNCQEQKDIPAAYFTIKDNMLDGDAVWLNLKGDTLKEGQFQNGLKVGEWMITSRRTDYSISKKSANQYIEKGYPIIDTSVIICHYENGAKTGYFKRFFSSAYPVEEGYFKEGKRVGEWKERDIIFKGIGKNRKRVRDNKLITRQFTIAEEDTIKSFDPLIRNGLLDTYDAPPKVFNFDSKYPAYEPPLDLFQIAFASDPDLDLEEEKFGSYEMDEFGDEELYELEGMLGDYDYSYEHSYYQPTIWDKTRQQSFKRGYIIDSIGMIANYSDLFEAHYPNGQLAFRFNFKEGKLLKEDTVFWDNGNPHDVIEFIADSNQYLRSVYDYEGKLYKQLSLDSLGDFVRVAFEFDNAKFVFLDGLKAEDTEYGSYYFYNKYDTLQSEIAEPLLLFRSWYKADSSVLYNTYYNPENRELQRTQHAVTGRVATTSVKSFSESFESWTGKDSTHVGPLTLITTASASLFEGDYFQDSIPQNNVNFPYQRFDVGSEYRLKKNGSDYTGPVELIFNTSNFSISKKDLTIKLPKSNKRSIKKTKKNIYKYRTSGKNKEPLILNYIDASDYERNIGSYFYADIFNQMLEQTFNYPEDYNSYDRYEDDYYNDDYASNKTKYPVTSKIEGYMLDGKPHGVWKSYDQFNKIMTEANFEKGQTHGALKQYTYAYPKDSDTDFYNWENEGITDSLPSKKTYYLNLESEYKNGLLDGKSTVYEWYGDVASETSYKEGMRDGQAFERNTLAITKMNYEFNVLDGYMQTYLTLKNRDSILLYDLNFQDGLLQGESKSYHLNGQLSKRGFFLNGDPIDDYEAFDSLGFKYHYVKFKYSYPVEEKIWEENELSVRYLFDWQDSIYFSPTDITSSNSLDRMLFNLGFGKDYLAQPYFGRPTLLNKKGVRYHMTKYYPNDTITRDGELDKGRKIGCWKFFNYEGEKLYEVNYFDTVLVLNDSISFRSKGILTDFDANGEVLFESYIIEKFEKYDCAHTDHYEIRQLYTIWESNDSLGRINGYVTNYYDNGVIQSEGELKDGLPTGFWKIYDPYGKLNQYGQYVLGKRTGRWLSGDLSKTKYLGDICLNPNLPDLEEEIKYRENLLDITITNYKLGRSLNKQFFDINMNKFLELEEEEVIEE